ncbi:MAG: nucleotidyltransferase domain-containing protein [Anaerolineales bacterium]
MCVPGTHLPVLQLLCERLSDADVVWAVTGSTGLAAQGVAVDVHDIDVQSDRLGAYAIAALFPGRVVRPVEFSAAANIRSHYGALEIEAVTVEIMGDVEKRLAAGTWESPPDLTAQRRWVQLGGFELPVLSLEYELGAYATLGRAHTVRAIRRALLERAAGDE